MEPVKLGDLVLGMGSDPEGYPKEFIGMVITDIPGFQKDYQRWMVQWPDGEKSTHGTNIIRMMKDDLKRRLNG